MNIQTSDKTSYCQIQAINFVRITYLVNGSIKKSVSSLSAHKRSRETKLVYVLNMQSQETINLK